MDYYDDDSDYSHTESDGGDGACEDPNQEVEALEIHLKVIQGDQLVAKHRNMMGQWTTSDPYVEVRMFPRGLQGPDIKLGQSEVVRYTLKPKWNFETEIELSLGHVTDDCQFMVTIFDWDEQFTYRLGPTQNDIMGVVPVNVTPNMYRNLPCTTRTRWYGVPATSADRASGRIQCKIDVMKRRKRLGSIKSPMFKEPKGKPILNQATYKPSSAEREFNKNLKAQERRGGGSSAETLMKDMNLMKMSVRGSIMGTTESVKQSTLGRMTLGAADAVKQTALGGMNATTQIASLGVSGVKTVAVGSVNGVKTVAVGSTNLAAQAAKGGMNGMMQGTNLAAQAAMDGVSGVAQVASFGVTGAAQVASFGVTGAAQVASFGVNGVASVATGSMNVAAQTMKTTAGIVTAPLSIMTGGGRRSSDTGASTSMKRSMSTNNMFSSMPFTVGGSGNHDDDDDDDSNNNNTHKKGGKSSMKRSMSTRMFSSTPFTPGSSSSGSKKTDPAMVGTMKRQSSFSKFLAPYGRENSARNLYGRRGSNESSVSPTRRSSINGDKQGGGGGIIKRQSSFSRFVNAPFGSGGKEGSIRNLLGARRGSNGASVSPTRRSSMNCDTGGGGGGGGGTMMKRQSSFSKFMSPFGSSKEGSVRNLLGRRGSNGASLSPTRRGSSNGANTSVESPKPAVRKSSIVINPPEEIKKEEEKPKKEPYPKQSKKEVKPKENSLETPDQSPIKTSKESPTALPKKSQKECPVTVEKKLLEQLMQEAAASGDYMLAGKLQGEIKQLEAYLEEQSKSQKESITLETKIRDLKEKMQQAVSEGDYMLAGKLQEELKALEAKLKQQPPKKDAPPQAPRRLAAANSDSDGDLSTVADEIPSTPKPNNNEKEEKAPPPKANNEKAQYKLDIAKVEAATKQERPKPVRQRSAVRVRRSRSPVRAASKKKLLMEGGEWPEAGENLLEGSTQQQQQQPATTSSSTPQQPATTSSEKTSSSSRRNSTEEKSKKKKIKKKSSTLSESSRGRSDKPKKLKKKSSTLSDSSHTKPDKKERKKLKKKSSICLDSDPLGESSVQHFSGVSLSSDPLGESSWRNSSSNKKRDSMDHQQTTKRTSIDHVRRPSNNKGSEESEGNSVSSNPHSSKKSLPGRCLSMDGDPLSGGGSSHSKRGHGSRSPSRRTLSMDEDPLSLGGGGSSHSKRGSMGHGSSKAQQRSGSMGLGYGASEPERSGSMGYGSQPQRSGSMGHGSSKPQRSGSMGHGGSTPQRTGSMGSKKRGSMEHINRRGSMGSRSPERRGSMGHRAGVAPAHVNRRGSMGSQSPTRQTRRRPSTRDSIGPVNQPQQKSSAVVGGLDQSECSFVSTVSSQSRTRQRPSCRDSVGSVGTQLSSVAGMDQSDISHLGNKRGSLGYNNPHEEEALEQRRHWSGDPGLGSMDASSVDQTPAPEPTPAPAAMPEPEPEPAQPVQPAPETPVADGVAPQETEVGFYVDADGIEYYLDANGIEYYKDADGGWYADFVPEGAEGGDPEDTAGWFMDVDGTRYYVDEQGVEYYEDPRDGEYYGDHGQRLNLQQPIKEESHGASAAEGAAMYGNFMASLGV